jgi:hypothetical protein
MENKSVMALSTCPFRCAVIGIAAEVGGLCKALLSSCPHGNIAVIETALIKVLYTLWSSSILLNGNLLKVLEGKFALNETKYPIGLCTVSAFANLFYVSIVSHMTQINFVLL